MMGVAHPTALCPAFDLALYCMSVRRPNELETGFVEFGRSHHEVEIESGSWESNGWYCPPVVVLGVCIC